MSKLGIILSLTLLQFLHIIKLENWLLFCHYKFIPVPSRTELHRVCPRCQRFLLFIDVFINLCLFTFVYSL